MGLRWLANAGLSSPNVCGASEHMIPPDPDEIDEMGNDEGNAIESDADAC